MEKVFLKMPQNFFVKVAGWTPETLFEKQTLTQVFYCEFFEILRTPILLNICKRLVSETPVPKCLFNKVDSLTV